MKAKALWHLNNTKTAILEEEIVENGNIKLLIKAKYSGISSGTETLVAKGQVTGTLKQNMIVNYMGGSFDFPIKYGYSLVGETDDGRYVHLMHPHQDKLFVREADLFTIPANLPLKRATLLSNMETTINAVWDAKLKGSEKVLIIGFGGIGALLALTVKLYTGINPTVYELDISKLTKAKDLGFLSDNGDFDVIFHTSSSNEGLQFAIDHVRKDGSVIELSWYGNKQLNLNFGGNFHYNRVKLISSQVSTISPFAPIQSYQERKEIACELLINNIFDEVISQEILFEDSPAYFDILKLSGNKNAFNTIINYI
jgi:threonine dehydrogenase-like Zn-dependent dehydrogenase